MKALVAARVVSPDEHLLSDLRNSKLKYNDLTLKNYFRKFQKKSIKAKNCCGLGLPSFYLIPANSLQNILKCKVSLHIEKTFCEEIQVSDLPFIIPIIKQYGCFNNINIDTFPSASWEFLKINMSSLHKFTPIWKILTSWKIKNA